MSPKLRPLDGDGVLPERMFSTIPSLKSETGSAHQGSQRQSRCVPDAMVTSTGHECAFVTSFANGFGPSHRIQLHSIPTGCTQIIGKVRYLLGTDTVVGDVSPQYNNQSLHANCSHMQHCSSATMLLKP